MTALAPPGSTAWLLRHELRVAWREAKFFGARGRSMTRPLVIMAVMQIALLPAGWLVSHMPETPFREAVLITTVLLALAWSAMLAQTLVSAAQAMFLRGDLDLLMAAPIPPRSVMTVRALAIAVTAVTGWTVLAMLLVNAMALFGQFRWLMLYPVFAALALTASAAALACATALFALLGARRMRIAAQALAAVIGLAVVFASQAPSLMGRSVGPNPFQALVGDGSGVAWWPARAALGEPLPLLAMLAAAVALFALTVTALGPRFAAQAAAAIGRDNAAPARRRRGARFRAGARAALLHKEWRLLRRDPWLISQVMMQGLYLLPLGLAMWRGGASAAATDAGLAITIVVIAGSITSGLAWITIAGEDAPELLACAPVSRGAVTRAKLLAATLPVAALVALPIAILALRAPLQALAAVAGSTGAMIGATLLQVWHPQMGRRREFSYRHRLSIMRGLFELAANMAWGFAAALTVVAPEIALVVWLIAIAILPALWFLRPRGTALAP